MRFERKSGGKLPLKGDIDTGHAARVNGTISGSIYGA